MTVGWRTLDVGEKALVYSHEGHARIEEGPKRLFLWRETYKPLHRVAATQTDYLQIVYKDGKKEHRKGPCVEFINPVVHKSIKKCDLESLDANEALVVYSSSEKSEKASRRIEYGPTLFMLKPNEWLHRFVWHGTDPNNKTRFIPKQNKFTNLRIIPDQFYYNVDEIRTSDDALIRVKLMMFYELNNLELMLDSTVDPMADFINCLCADVVAYAAKKTYLEFIEQVGELNDLKSFPRLVERCRDIGYSVTKVVFRGYHAHDKLQRMHDSAITQRTELKLSYEKEEQEQALVDAKLNADISRMEQEQKIEREALQNKHEMEKSKLIHTLKLEKQKHQQAKQKELQEHQARMQAKQSDEDQTAQHLGEMSRMGVDINRVMLSQTARPKEVIQVVTGADRPNVHLHYS
ncbi:uncharacterized protein LOC143275420 [Babylonia areolata]|uniref:uncharacterized protein LOC143275420 n=1 Tax=Babylonia areolata TaxID=304850 RepID=UPI003FD01461